MEETDLGIWGHIDEGSQIHLWNNSIFVLMDHWLFFIDDVEIAVGGDLDELVVGGSVLRALHTLPQTGSALGSCQTEDGDEDEDDEDEDDDREHVGIWRDDARLHRGI